MRVIIPGRSFISYLLNIAHSVKELHHHVTLNSSCKNDLLLWHKFLDQWNGISFFIDDNIVNASDFDLYTDAASTVGFGGYFKNRWFQALWPVEMKLDTELSLSMAYMELYPIVIAAIIWGNEWSGNRILFHCDNMATVLIIKKGRSKSLEIMRLMRRLTWCSAKYNVIIYATHVAGKCNTIADALSRLQMDRSRQLCPTASVEPCHCPPHSEILWN
ncbi:unnamed protein product [Mytilus coruscus]|uniref:Reverse transcriptase RNase H-like domain-containing protein n=1 Tax=Mytilus coruscus TaxID=42192 RepID=A0A6J8C9Y4_MYTCO|nr:unnamed protein product [Mytilus coruscus]